MSFFSFLFATYNYIDYRYRGFILLLAFILSVFFSFLFATYNYIHKAVLWDEASPQCNYAYAITPTFLLFLILMLLTIFIFTGRFNNTPVLGTDTSSVVFRHLVSRLQTRIPWSYNVHLGIQSREFIKASIWRALRYAGQNHGTSHRTLSRNCFKLYFSYRMAHIFYFLFLLCTFLDVWVL